MAKDAHLRGTKLSVENFKLLKQRGANDQTPSFQHLSLVLMGTWNSFFKVSQKDYELPLIGQRIALYLVERDQLSMSCVNLSCYRFFVQLRRQRKTETSTPDQSQNVSLVVEVASPSPLQPSVYSPSNLEPSEQHKQNFGCSINCKLL